MSHYTILSQITIAENRQRQEFDPDALQELGNSIEDRGLLHAPVMREVDGKLFLVAGERRLKAIEQIYALGGSFMYNGALVPEGAVPYVTLGELTPLEAEEAELDENLRRKDLTWQEHAAALKRLHELRQAQATKRANAALDRGENPDTEGGDFKVHTVADTAREILPHTADLSSHELGGRLQRVQRELIVARHLKDPDVAKAKTVEDAFKILKKKEAVEKNLALSAQVGKTFSAKDHTLRNASCLDELVKPEYQGRYDVILSDPPYGMGADDFGDGAGRLVNSEHHYDDSYEAWQKLMWDFTYLSAKVTKPQAHAYLFCDIDRFHELKEMMQKAGWYVFRTPLINHKLNSGRVPLPEHGPRRCYEIILYAIKGNKPVTHIYPDVMATQADDNMTHGAQKPVAAYQNLLQRSVRPGDEVLDAFAGSGTLLPAAHSLQCKATVLEQEPEYFAMCVKRAQSLDLEAELAA